jgi:hypothetical protein
MKFSPEEPDEYRYIIFKVALEESPEYLLKNDYNHFSKDILGNYLLFLKSEIDDLKNYSVFFKIVIVTFLIFLCTSYLEGFREFLSNIQLLEFVDLITDIIKYGFQFIFISFMIYLFFGFFKEINEQNRLVDDYNVYQKVLKKHILESANYENFLDIRKKYYDKINQKLNL